MRSWSGTPASGRFIVTIAEPESEDDRHRRARPRRRELLGLGLELHGSQIQPAATPPKAAEPKAVPSVRLAGGLDGFGGGLDELRHLVGVRDHRYVTGLDFDGGCAHAPSELGQRRRARRSPSSFLSCSNSQP